MTYPTLAFPLSRWKAKKKKADKSRNPATSDRAGTGSEFTGSGSVLGFRFLSPLGLAKFSLEPVGLMKVAIKPCDMGKISLNLCNRAYSGFQKRLWKKSGPGFIWLLAFVVRAWHWAQAQGLGPRLVPALTSDRLAGALTTVLPNYNFPAAQGF